MTDIKYVAFDAHQGMPQRPTGRVDGVISLIRIGKMGVHTRAVGKISSPFRRK
jgi:hypothetical protein